MYCYVLITYTKMLNQNYNCWTRTENGGGNNSRQFSYSEIHLPGREKGSKSGNSSYINRHFIFFQQTLFHTYSWICLNKTTRIFFWTSPFFLFVLSLLLLV